VTNAQTAHHAMQLLTLHTAVTTRSLQTVQWSAKKPRNTSQTLQRYWNLFRWQQTHKRLSKQVWPMLQTSAYMYVHISANITLNVSRLPYSTIQYKTYNAPYVTKMLFVGTVKI